MTRSWHGAALPLVIALLATIMTGCVSQQVADRANQRALLGGLTRAEFQTASHVARREAQREGAHVRTAAADLLRGSRRSVLGVHREVGT
jgi:hypothetical protein